MAESQLHPALCRRRRGERGVLRQILGRPAVESSPSFAMIPAAPGVMLGLWRRDGVAPPAGAPGGGEIAITAESEADGRGDDRALAGARRRASPSRRRRWISASPPSPSTPTATGCGCSARPSGRRRTRSRARVVDPLSRRGAGRQVRTRVREIRRVRRQFRSLFPGAAAPTASRTAARCRRA